MTDTTEIAAPAVKRRGLTALRLAELQEVASGMGIRGISGMRKGDLIAAIKARDTAPVVASAAPAATPAAAIAEQPAPARRSRRASSPATAPQARRADAAAGEASVQADLAELTASRSATHGESPAAARAESDGTPERETRAKLDDRQPERRQRAEGRQREEGQRRDSSRDDSSDRQADQSADRQRDAQRDGQDESAGQPHESRRDDRRDGGAPQRDNREQRDNRDNRDGQRDNRQRSRVNDDDSASGSRRRNRQRSRDRKRRGGRSTGVEDYQNEPVESVGADDVLVPVAGILDVLDNYAFVRTSGYLPGPNDVYVPLGHVKKYGLRKGDAVTGAVRALRPGEQLPARQKFNALVRLDSVNGADPEQSRDRVEFNKLTPLYPQQRLRLETEPNVLTTRIIDLVSPIGKGQRGLIVAPAKAGKTMVMQAVANAITTNNPECHLMVVLVDERPEEVTDMQRAVKGEVISSTFDRPADDHTTVAELAIERAKRLVELGHDVVVLLDSITKLGRAYNLAAPASGRILSGGVDSAALYPPKRFFGAARNIEHGGSLTILATALVETGSKMDEVIFEEFKGTGNMELKLDRQLANRRIFPAVDVNASGTRREEILLATEELRIMWKLRRVLAALDTQQGIELLIDRLKKSKSNAEFLMTVQKTSNIHLDDD